jgi:hypothetical protein
MNRSRCRTVASFERSSTLGVMSTPLPRSIHEREEWQAVMEVLLSAVEGREPVGLLRIALTLALQESRS